VVPHVARSLVGIDHRWVIACSGLLGALLVLLTDVLGRVLVRPAELPVGIVMALVGGGMVVAQTVEERLELDPATTAPTSGPKGSGTSSTSVAPGAPAPAPTVATCPPDALPGTC